MRSPYARPSMMYGVNPTTRPSTGEYTAVPGAAPTSSPLVCGPWPPPIWYQAGPWLAAAEELVAEPREESLVRLPPDRRQRERAVAGSVVADRRDAARRDRQLQP